MTGFWRNSLLICLLFATSSALLAASCGDDPDEQTPPDPTHNEILGDLGVETDLGSRTDPEGNPVREDYNPLTSPRTYFHRLSETYAAGFEMVDGDWQNLVGDLSEEYAMVYNETTDDAWAKLPKTSAAGDLDGDGLEEMVVLVLNNVAGSGFGELTVRIIEDSIENYTVEEKVLTKYEDLSRFADHFAWHSKLDLATGDVDGDGRDEILISVLSDLWVLDDRSESYAVIYYESFPRISTTGQWLRVTAGDTDCDGKEEMVVVDGQISGASGSASYYIYDETFTRVKEGLVQVVIDAISYLLMTADVSVGDVDGDRLNEIVFNGRQTTVASTFQVLVMDDAMHGYEFLPLRYQYTHGNPIFRVETGDFDGDAIDEIFTYNSVLDDLNQAENKLLKRISTIDHVPYHGMVFDVGDVSDDIKEDIVFFSCPNGDCWLLSWGTNSTGQFVRHLGINTLNTASYPTVATINSDEDSAMLEFLDHELLFTKPRVISVLAAPPWFNDVETDNGDAGTTFGQGTGSEVNSETSMGFTVGFTVGTEFEDRLFSQSKARFTVSVETAVDWVSSSSLQIEKAYYYNSTADTDKVVFTAIPFDVYYYKVLQSPEPEEVGSTMIINIPREPQTLFVDREFYNSNNGDAMDVDERVLTHTIGEPDSYPAEGSVDKSALNSGGGFYSDSMTVGQGPGSQTIEIAVTEGQGYGTNFDLNITTEFEVGSGGFVVGGSAGFHYGYSYNVTSTESTHFSGTVGNIIKENDWTDKYFNFGLFVEPKTVQGQQFPVIQYWVN